MQVPQIFISHNSEKNPEGCTDQLKATHSVQDSQSREQCNTEEGACDARPVEKSLNLEEHSLHLWKGVSRCFTISSFHGLPFLAASLKTKIKLIAWIIALSLAFTFMIFSLSAVSTKYGSGRIYTSNNRHFPKELPFPAVTLCNINPFKATAILARGMSFLQANLLLAHIRARNNMSVPIPYFSALVQQYDAASGGNGTLYEDLGHRINDLVLSCTFDGRRCSVDDFTARATSSGVCYTFNPNGDLTHHYSGKHGYRYGLIIRVNIEQYEYFLSEVTTAGLNVFIHHHDHFPYTSDYRRLLLSPGRSALLSITKTRYTRLPPPTGICGDHVTLTMFKSYTRESCLIECETRLAIKACGCKAEYMPGSETACSLNQTLYCILPHAKTFQVEMCDCPVSCSNIVYDTHLSYSRFPATHLTQVYNNSYFIQSGVVPVPSFAVANYTDANGTVIYYFHNVVNPSLILQNYLKLAVYYEALEYNVVTEEIQYTLGRFVADFIGFIGFFIGAGFLSIFEAIELIHSFINPPK